VSAPRRRISNILLTCPRDVGFGGVQQVFQKLITALEIEGRHVELLYPGRFPSVRLRRAPNAWGREAFYCPMPILVRKSVLLGFLLAALYAPITVVQLVRLLRRKKIDVVNCHYLSEYFIHVVMAARLAGVPVVISVHGADVDRYAGATRAERFLLRLIMRGADRIVACSEAMASQTMETFPAILRKVTHVHNAVHLADFDDARGNPLVKGPFVLSVCRQVQKKGVDTLLRAFGRLQEFPDLMLVVIGAGPLLESNRALARALGIEGRVVFTGNLPHAEVLPYIAACRLFVVPSRAEPFGLVVLEAAYYRKGMVCTRVGGIPEILTDNATALLVEPDDHIALAEKMAILLRDPDRAARFGNQAHQTLMRRFRWDDRVHDYLAIYETSSPSTTAFSAARVPTAECSNHD
jgi:glycosyltransferase involved in cell wall biosynthesis